MDAGSDFEGTWQQVLGLVECGKRAEDRSRTEDGVVGGLEERHHLIPVRIEDDPVALVDRALDEVGRGTSTFDGLSISLWVELVIGFLIPLALFSIPDIRASKWGLFGSSCLLASGVLLTRLNTAVFGIRVENWETYFPSMGEFMTTLGVLAGLILIYGLALKHLPIHSEEPLDEAPRLDSMPHGAATVTG